MVFYFQDDNKDKFELYVKTEFSFPKTFSCPFN